MSPLPLLGWRAGLRLCHDLRQHARGPGLPCSRAERDRFDVAFGQFFARLDPVQVYRFDENDDWEMIIGDLDKNVYPAFDDWGALEGTPVFSSRLGNYGAGFYNPSLEQVLQGDDTNLSFNQYTWWMDTYGGNLYCTTFDYRVFTRYIRDLTSDPTVIERLLTWWTGSTPTRPGFDLYVTKDGITRERGHPRRVRGPYNYGGRTLKSTPEGLFVGTANPFWGAQVWKVTGTVDEGGDGGGECGCSFPGRLRPDGTAPPGPGVRPITQEALAGFNRQLLSRA